MNKVNLLFYMLMTALSLTSYVTSAQGLSNTERLQEILPQTSWSYLFPKSAISYQQFVHLAAKRPQFCGASKDQAHNQSASKSAEQLCRGQLANVFAQLSTMTALNDVNLEIEPWRQGLMVANKRLCSTQSQSTTKIDDNGCLGLMSQLIDRAIVDANIKRSNAVKSGHLSRNRSSHSMPSRRFSTLRHYDLFAGFLQVP